MTVRKKLGPQHHGSSAEDKRVAKELENVVAPVVATYPSFNGTSFLLTSDWSTQYNDCPRLRHVYEHVVLKHENVGSYHWNGHRLFLRERICVPNALCADVIKTIHERAHFGMEKTKALVERRFDVSNISSFTRYFIGRIFGDCWRIFEYLFPSYSQPYYQSVRTV